MNNSLFISRCETILATMKGGNFSTITTKQVAKWLNIEDSAASQVVARACKYNILQKIGATINAQYKLTSACYNSLESKSNTSSISEAAKYVAEWFVNHSSKSSVKKILTTNGKTFVKVESQEELDSESKHAIDNILLIIEKNKEYQVEIERLKAQVEKLKSYEEYYKKITSVKV